MEPQIPTSFIPKRPVAAGSQPDRASNTRAVGILSLVSGIVVIATIVSFGFVFFYERTLSTQKEKLEQSINDARNGVGTDFLAEMKRLNARISGVHTLLSRHIVVTPIFTALQQSTLRSVQYRSFTYQFMNDPVSRSQVVQVMLTGTAKNYATIALQSDAFAESKLIRNPVFSGLNIDEAGKGVGFTLTFDVSPEDLSFESFITPKQPAATTTPTL